MVAEPRNVYVLIVEDEEENIELLTRTLRADARLWIARSVAEAQKILTENQVNVVVADHRLPDGEGATLLSLVAQGFPSVGRVLVTAYADSEGVVAACQQGIVERFFLKPYSPQQLRGGVLGLLRRHGTVELPKVLLADDDPAVRQIIRELLVSKHLKVHDVADGEAAIQASDDQSFDVALIDVTMPKMDGVGVLRHLLRQDPDMPVIMLTAVELSVGLTLLEAGAFDLVNKPIRKEELFLRVERGVIARRQQEQHKQLLLEVRARRQKDDLVAESPAMQSVVEQSRMVAKHDVNVLVNGETGTGKEVIARLVHRESRRCEGPFIPVNCGAIPDTLIESELFGHVRGAFTDAKETKAGFFESADGGSIFLDEIGELSLQAQIRLLRVLETKEIQRVGSSTPVRVDVRVIAATHQDLDALVKSDKFRQDLYYRLHGFAIQIPPLRDRPQDIGPLIEMAATNFCVRNGMPVPEIATSALQTARRYPWPGNVRELLHVMERTLITHGPTRIDTIDISAERRVPTSPTNLIDDNLPLREAIEPLLEDLEKAYLRSVLNRCEGHLGRTAKHAGIHRKSLYNKLKKYGITGDR